jgi:hypothetical protein
MRATIAAARKRLDAAERAANQTTARLIRSRETLTALQEAGAPAPRRREVRRRIAKLRTERKRRRRAVREARTEVERLRNAASDGVEPETLVAGLEGQVPVTLLPVRLETRFTEDATGLRIRIFPEPIHEDHHEPGLTDAERQAAEGYWRARWAARTDADEARAAWRRLTAAVPAPRARWLVDVTTPTNLARLGQGEPAFPDVPRRPAPWTRAARAELLPERWVALGYRGGQEVLRAWGATISEQLAMGPAPDLDPADDEPVGPDELPIDDELRWLIDYEEALRTGMAITATTADMSSGTLSEGLDTLVVLGVDWSRDPAAAADALDVQLAAKRASDGLTFIPAGTPTNNTGEAPAGDAAAAALDPFDPPPPAAPGSAGRRAGRALGLKGRSALRHAPGAGALDDELARHMAHVLWPTTWGYFLDQIMQPLVNDGAEAGARDHFRRYVRGGGPLATLRVGRQPYGLLPVVAPAAWRGDDPVAQAIGNHVGSARALWQQAIATILVLGTGDQPEYELVSLLRMTPRSKSFRTRLGIGPTVVSAGTGFELLAPFQELSAQVTLGLAGIEGRPRLVDLTLVPTHLILPVPLVAYGRLSETDPLDPNYISQLAEALGSPGGFSSLTTAGPPFSLLDALLRQSAQLEVADAAAELVVNFELERGTLESRPPQVRVRERELHGIDPAEPLVGDAAGESLLGQVRGKVELAELSVLGISGNETIADHLAGHSIQELVLGPGTSRLGELRAGLEALAGLPQAQIERLAAETLDCCSHRLDAWVTSLATRRLDTVRDTVSGAHVGGFGWVEDLRPREAPASLGYVHAPSVPQAVSAAILRSGHLGRRADASGALALDLSSQRVARALELLDGTRTGQPIGALLGYRLERGLRDRRIELAGYVLALRRAAPLATATDGFGDNRPVEAVAARDVVDGLALLDLWRPNPEAFFTGTPDLPASGPDRADLQAELEELDDLLDALTDLLMAEGVHQMVAGNDERAGAALDALDRQAGLPDTAVAHTPRTGSSASQRLLVALQDGAAPAGWARDPRAEAEPRLNAWAARLLGDPAGVQFAAVARDDESSVVDRVEAALPELGQSPLATLLAAALPGGDAHASELEARLGLVLASKVEAPEATVLELLPDPPSGAPARSIGLADLLALSREVIDLMGACRPAGAADLLPADEAVAIAGLDENYDVADCRRRADAAVAALRSAVEDLPTTDSAADAETLGRHLLAASAAGVPGAVPAGAGREALAVQVEAVRAAGSATLASLQAAEAGIDRAAAGPTAEVEHDLSRMRAVFGEAFPVAPVFRAANRGALRASLADANALLDGDSLAPATWLARQALVRPAAGRLSAVLSGAEALARSDGVGADHLQVAQLPHRSGDRWLALSGDRPAGSLALVVHTPDGLRPGRRMAALVVDAWQEVVPDDTETTGVSFHFDAPGARAPQTLLLAVPPSSTFTSWSVETLADTVLEALALARLRAVESDRVAALPRFLPAIYLAYNQEGVTPSFDVQQLVQHAIEIDNQLFLAEQGAGPA